MGEPPANRGSCAQWPYGAKSARRLFYCKDRGYNVIPCARALYEHAVDMICVLLVNPDASRRLIQSLG